MTEQIDPTRDGESLSWLIEQCHHWPDRVHPDRTTSPSYLLPEAAASLKQQAATIARLTAERDEARAMLEDIAQFAEARIADGGDMGARIWRIALEGVLHDAIRTLAKGEG